MKQLLAILCLLPLACGKAADSAGAKTVPRNVVLICWDTVRADRVGAYGYTQHPTTPNLDALASVAVLFEDASSVAGWTKPSVPSFLTGTYPLQHGVYEGSSKGAAGKTTHVLPERATTLAEVFAERGYATAAFVHNAQLRRGTGIEQGFELYDDKPGDARGLRTRAEAWLAERDPEQPFFLYLHFLDAHWPYPIPNEYATRFATAEQVTPFQGSASRSLFDAVNDGERVLDEDESRALSALYDGALSYLDHELGLFLGALEREGFAEQTVVSLLSDHGEEFGEHGRIGHGHGLWENLLRVPWILRVPGVPAVRVPAPVSLIDVFATLTAAAGVSTPATHAGRNRLTDHSVPRGLFSEHKAGRRYLQAWRSGDGKLVRELAYFEPTSWEFDALALLRPGSRWNMKLERVTEGLRVVEFELSEDELDDPIEWKGSITKAASLSEGRGRFEISGVEVQFPREVEFYGECRGDEGALALLTLGRWVKVKARMHDGQLEAAKIKMYGLEDDALPELRAVVESVDQDRAQIHAAGFLLLYNDEVQWEIGEGKPKWSPNHKQLMDGLLRGSAKQCKQSLVSYDLASDPGELNPRTVDVSELEDGSRWNDLQRVVEGLSGAVVSGAGEVQGLSKQALEELRALGYVE